MTQVHEVRDWPTIPRRCVLCGKHVTKQEAVKAEVTAHIVCLKEGRAERS